MIAESKQVRFLSIISDEIDKINKALDGHKGKYFNLRISDAHKLYDFLTTFDTYIDQEEVENKEIIDLYNDLPLSCTIKLPKTLINYMNTIMED